MKILSMNFKDFNKVLGGLHLLNRPQDILLSIKSKFVDKIEEGSKIIELRKKFTDKPINKIFIYSSGRDKKIVGIITKFFVQKVKYGFYVKKSLLDCACITEQEYDQYVGNKDFYIIHILKYEKFSIPLDLDFLYKKGTIKNKKPPQNFLFFNYPTIGNYFHFTMNDPYISYIDFLKIKNIYEKELSNFYDKEKLLDYFNNNLLKGDPYSYMSWHDSNNNLLGFITFHFKKDELKINTFYILPEYRNKGYSKKFFKEFLDKVPSVKITMYITKKLESISNYYLRLGFKIINKTDDNIYLEYRRFENPYE